MDSRGLLLVRRRLEAFEGFGLGRSLCLVNLLGPDLGGAGEVLDILIAFDAPVALNDPEEAHLLPNSGTCYVPRMDGLDHRNCEGCTASTKPSKAAQQRTSILRLTNIVQ